MYKEYRRSIFQHYLVWMSYVPYIVFFVYQRIVNGPFNIYVKGLVLYLGIILLICATGFNYVILESDRITLKNSFYFFWSRTFMYNDIVKIILNDDTQRKTIYLRIVTHTKMSRRYGIASIKESDFKRIAKDLKELNVELEIGRGVLRDYFR